uniref:NADH-ubiquinone oxidoreductase chain 2 n=1 Tax=Ctenolucius hujeta TaxID=303997 RepID=F7UIK7_9TELE|nr:NADH dehydrogenase subunit 2 [Ctenolucius hujeta]
MSPYTSTILYLSLGLGTMITLTSSHWLLAWMGLEINTLAIIPLMARHRHPRAVEATTKYFLTQATAAAMILFASTTNAWFTGEWDIIYMHHPIATKILIMALALKMGLAPLHFWLPEVLQGISLTTGLVLSTWQKLAPLALLFQVAHAAEPLLLLTLGLSSTLIGGWGGMNQTQLRKILAYSSIAHLGWLIIVINIAPQLALITLIVYIIMTSALFLAFELTKSTMTSTLALAWTKNPTMAATTTLVLLSLGGLPPLTGFIPKWLILQELTKQGYPVISTLIALTALLSLFFYTRLCYTMALTITPSTNNASAFWRLPNTQPTLPLAISTAMAIGLLPLTPAIMSLTP